MKIKLTLFILFLPILSFAQTVLIKGIVQDSTKLPLVGAQVLLYDSTQTFILNYAITNDSGFYKIITSKYNGNAFLTAQSMGYIKDNKPLYIPKAKHVIIKNFSLREKKVLLNEVIIKNNAHPMEGKKDTVTYNVNKFTNGSEEVVEDVLKELPGISVSENGKITYHGKPIDKVLVEGDNLLGKNYIVLTKNLSANTIKKIQAIENYIENKNLKGIEKSNKTVLNLVLKNDIKAKPYANIGLGFGNNSFYDVGVNTLGVNKKIKYYLLGSSNNIGINSAPNDLISLSTYKDDVKGPPFLTSINYEFSGLNTNIVAFNYIYFCLSNLLLNINKKLKIRNNLYFTKDKNLFDKIKITKFLLPTGNFTIRDMQSLVRKPLIGQGNLDVQYNLTKQSNLNYSIKYRIAQTKYNGSQTANLSFFNESLQNKEQYVSQNINYTNRVNKHNAFLVKAQYFYNRKIQDYILMPFPNSLPFISTSSFIDTANLLQKSNITEHLFKVRSEYLGVKGVLNYKLEIGYESRQQSLNSNLYAVNNNNFFYLNQPYRNDGQLNLQDFNVSFQNKYKWNKWTLLFEVPLHYKTLSYNNLAIPSKKSRSFVFSPMLGTKLEIKNITFSLLYISLAQYPELNSIYSGYLLTNYRTLKNGIYLGNIIRTQAIYANFVYQNFGRQIMFYWMFSNIYQNKTFGSKLLISKYFTVIEKAIVKGNRNLIFSTGFDKFLPFMFATVKLRASISKMQYFNFINQSDERQINLLSGVYSLNLNSGWKNFFNFYSGIKYNFYKVNIKNSKAISETKNLKAHIGFTFNFSKKLKVVIKNEAFFYDVGTSDSKNYYFLDANIKYVVKPNKLTFQLTGNNLLGKTTFDRMSITDYMISTTQYHLMPRQILLSVNYRF